MIDALVNALQFAGNVVDTPGSILRALLAGEGERSLTGILDPEQRVSGRDMLQNWGMVGENQEGLDGGDIAGFGAELLTDPLNLLGIGLLGKTSKAAGVANAMNKERSLIEALNAESMAMRAAGAMPEEIAAITKIVDETGMPKRMLHGTSQTFDKFDVEKLDPNAMYGRGIYTTDNPEIAGGVMSILEGNPASRRPGGTETRVIMEKPGYAHKGIFGEEAEAFPQVRMHYVDARNPFEMTAGKFTLDEMLAEIERLGGPNEQSRRFWSNGFNPAEGRVYTGDDILHTLSNYNDLDPESFRQILQKQGYDSITHTGGLRTGSDAHNVVIAFSPEQIYNPYIAPKIRDVPDLQNVPSMSPIIAALMAQNSLRPMHGGY